MGVNVTVFGQSYEVPSQFQTNAGFRLSQFYQAVANDGVVKPLTVNYTCAPATTPQQQSDSGSFFVNSTASNLTVTLPTATTGAVAGQVYYGAAVGTGSLTFNAGSAVVYSGTSTAHTNAICAQGQSVELLCVDGTHWIAFPSGATFT